MPRPTRNRTPPKKFGDFVDTTKVSKSVFNAGIQKTAKAKAKLPRIVGRSASAPPIGWKPPKGAKTFSDVTTTTDMDWTGPKAKGLRLVIPNLDGKGGNYQGMFLPFPEIASSTDKQLQRHLGAITDNMMSYQSSNQITEALGEATAALAMLRRFPSAKMRWGFHTHSGPGIDQIWEEIDSAGASIYYIVEAKGVGAQLTFKTHGPPPEIKQQMSIGWVLNNLVMMSRQDDSQYDIARTILDEMCLKEATNSSGGAYYSGYGGASKNYYAWQPRFRHGHSEALRRGGYGHMEPDDAELHRRLGDRLHRRDEKARRSQAITRLSAREPVRSAKESANAR